MSHQSGKTELFRTFQAAAGSPITAMIRDAAFAFTRVGYGHDHGSLHVTSGRDDAYYVVYQLRDHPAHEHWIDGRTAPAPLSPKGGLHIFSLDEPHEALLNQRFDSINLRIKRAYLDALAEDVGARPVNHLQVPEAWTTRDPWLSRLEAVLLGALEEGEAAGPLFVDHLAMVTALHLAERYGGLHRPATKTGGLAPWQERRAREMIASDLAKSRPLTEVAAECGLSVSHFAKAFKASCGLTPHGWLQASRIEQARTLLQQAHLSLAEIATSCGFADQSHFTRIFKQMSGLTPGTWRRVRLG